MSNPHPHSPSVLTRALTLPYALEGIRRFAVPLSTTWVIDVPRRGRRRERGPRGRQPKCTPSHHSPNSALQSPAAVLSLTLLGVACDGVPGARYTPPDEGGA
jgi:hypothetical protein